MNEKARNHAANIKNEISEMIPKLERAWNEYVSLYVKYENKRRILSDYALRGIIDKTKIPVPEKKSLTKALFEYRKKRGGTK